MHFASGVFKGVVHLCVFVRLEPLENVWLMSSLYGNKADFTNVSGIVFQLS